MKMEEKAKVDLWDLPEYKVYVKIKDNIRYEFFKFIRTKHGGAKKLSRLLGIRIENAYIYNWKYCVRFCSLKILKKLLSLMKNKDRKFYMKLISSNIEKLKAPSKGGEISNIIFPIRLSASLARIAGNLVGDGGISSEGEDRYRAYYTNKSRQLVQKFKKEILNVFPTVKIQEVIDKRYNTVKIKLPRIAGIVLSTFFGFQNNELKHVPESIKNSSTRIKSAFLRALFDDEGSVDIKGRKITIGVTVRSILDDMKNLLEEFNIQTSKIAEIKRTGNRKIFYNIAITGWWNFENFKKSIGFYHPLKSAKLKILIGSSNYRLMPHETRNKINEIIKNRNGINIKDLSKELKKPIETLKYHLHNLEKAKIIKSSVAKQNLKIYYAGGLNG